MNLNETMHPEIGCHIAVRLNHCIVVITCETIWKYNLYREAWKKYFIPGGKHIPVSLYGHCGAVIGQNVYTHGYDELWELASYANGFGWNIVQEKDGTKKPPLRLWHSGWEYENKLWIFGGWGISLTLDDLNDYGDYHESYNNQLLQFDFVTKEWTNMKCLGEVPSPRKNHVTTITGNIVWLYGGKRQNNYFDDLYQLDMYALTWTQVQTGHPKPEGRIHCTLNAITDKQLVLHGGQKPRSTALNDTWILDLPSKTWRQHTYEADGTLGHHTGCTGLSNDVIIICGIKENNTCHQNSFHVRLEPKMLQQLAMKVVYKHQDDLPYWKKCLPKKLIELML